MPEQWWVAISERTPGGPSPAEHLDDHLAAQIALEEAGVLMAAGPLDDADGVRRGLFVLRCGSRDEAVQALDADPFHARGVRSYTLHTWQVNEGRIR